MADDLTQAQTSAYDDARAYLKTIGLNPDDFQSLLSDAAIHQYSPTAFAQQIQSTPQFQAAFPEIKRQRENNIEVNTPAEIVTYRAKANELAQGYGLPAGFLTPQLVSDLISNGVSADELNGRIIQGFNAANSAPQDVKDQLFNYYGIDSGHLAAFFLDPKAGEDLMQKAVTVAGIGAAGTRSGYGGLSREEAEILQGGGVTTGQAATGLGQLSQEKELFGSLPGEAPGKDITRSEQLGTLLAPQGATQQELQKKAAQRKAQFGGGGGYTESSGGVTGLGKQ